MITFFRHIRKELMEKNKVTRYLLYALGEIILVVIGILIALGINNVSEANKNRAQERVILEDLRTEYDQNKEQLAEVMAEYERQFELLQELLHFISPSPKTVKDEKIDAYIFALGSLPNYVLSRDITNSITSSGKISLITNRDINYALSGNSQIYEQYVKWMDLNEKQVYDIILPYVMDKYPIKRVMNNFFRKSDVTSEFTIDKTALLTDIRFESMVANRMLDIETVLIRARMLAKNQEQVLELINRELE